MRAFDTSTAAAATSVPGIDPRAWCSHGTVDPETQDAKSVEFTIAYGPLVRVTLHPSGVPVVCRVAHAVAGDGEGEWYPFVGGDEVQVLINEGDERAGCTIVGRLNQEIDAWPQKVAGLDATKNNFGFRRLRAPYFVETASTYAIRNATTKSFIAMSDTGAISLTNADGALLAMTPTLLGIQNGDADCLIQIDVENKVVIIEAQGTMFGLGDNHSSFYTKGALQIGTMGNAAAEHATSIEAVANVLFQILQTAAFFASFATGSTGPALGLFLDVAAGFPIDPALLQSISAGLATPKSPQSIVGLGAPGLLIG